MSAATIQAREWALDQNLPCTPKMVLVILGDMANSKPDHTCWPSMEKLAAKCGLAVRTVRDAIKDLIRSKFLRVLGLHEWGTPLYQLAVGETLKWIGRLRGSHQAKQGRLFPAPGRTEAVRQLPPNPESELTRERDAQTSAEHITENGYTFTVWEYRDLKESRGTELPAILDAMRERYGNAVANPHRLARAWKLVPSYVERTPHKGRETVAPVESPNVDVFNRCLCRFCDVPHEWKTDREYADVQMREKPCPEVRGLKCVEVLV